MFPCEEVSKKNFSNPEQRGWRSSTVFKVSALVLTFFSTLHCAMQVFDPPRALQDRSLLLEPSISTRDVVTALDPDGDRGITPANITDAISANILFHRARNTAIDVHNALSPKQRLILTREEVNRKIDDAMADLERIPVIMPSSGEDLSVVEIGRQEVRSQLIGYMAKIGRAQEAIAQINQIQDPLLKMATLLQVQSQIPMIRDPEVVTRSMRLCDEVLIKTERPSAQLWILIRELPEPQKTQMTARYQEKLLQYPPF
jgi:hypothetical protein